MSRLRTLTVNRQRLTKPFTWLIIVLGGAALCHSLARLPLDRLDLRYLLLSLVTVAFGSRLIVKIPRVRGDITVSDTFVFLTLLLYGGEAAVLLATCEAFITTQRVTRTRPTQLFNTAMMTVSTYLTGLAVELNFAPLDALTRGEFNPRLIMMVCLMGLVQYATNAGLASVRSGFLTGRPLLDLWGKSFLWASITYFAGASAAALIARLAGTIGVYAFIFTTPIIATIYLTYRTYLKNIEVSQQQVEQARQHVEELSHHIAEQQRIWGALQESEEQFRNAFDHAAGMALVAPGGHWRQVNQSLCHMLGYTEAELLEARFQDLTHPDDLGEELIRIDRLLSGKAATTQLEKRYLHKGGREVWVLSSASIVRTARGEPSHFIFQIQDVTERKRAEAHVHHAAFHDALTGLPNRVLLTERLAQAIERTHGGHGDRQFAVLFVDLDRFKVVNDSLGHPSGDWLLIALSGRLKQCVRTTDTVARLGGDEFAILLNGLEEGYDPATIAGRIYEQLSRPFELGGHEVFTSASIGIAYSTTGYERPEDILRDADTAMYRAKSNGKARHEVFDVAMHAHAFEQLKLETDLRHALDRGEIEVYYQPIYVLSGGRAEGFEALVRWRHPERGLIPPLEFIPLAEETGLIVPIGMHVLDTACRQVREWNQALPADAPLSISVNISGRQFKEKDFVGHVERMLKATGLPPSCLRLEITETVVMDNTEEVARILERLKACGVRISLDDFGTGYSSLSYLHRFPINTLKIDRSFVQSMGADAESAKIIKTILTLAAELNMDVVAEGIETGQQRDQLRALGCDFGQGYLFSRPVESGEAWNLVARAASTARGRAAGAISRGQTDAAVEPSHELAAV